jgi:cell division cycle 14
VVRLNKKYYDERKFINAGINHVEHYYLDGSVPPMRILKKVIAAIESAGDAAIAVHCKAGLGRAGTCTASWIMKVRLRGDEGTGEGRRGSSRGRM